MLASSKLRSSPGDFAASYSDNVYVFTRVDDFELHLQHVTKVVKRLVKYDMVLTKAKQNLFWHARLKSSGSRGVAPGHHGESGRIQVK